MKTRSKKNLAVRNQLFLSASQLFLDELSGEKEKSIYSTITLEIDELFLLKRLVKFVSRGELDLEQDKNYHIIEDKLFNKLLKK